MARSGGAEIDRVLEIVVGEINSLAEPQGGGPPVTLTLGGSVVSGTIIPDWQWFDEVEHAARAQIPIIIGLRLDADGSHRGLEPELAQHDRSIGGDLDAGSDLVQHRRLFEHQCVDTLMAQRNRSS